MGSTAVTYKDLILCLGTVSACIGDLHMKEEANKHGQIRFTAVIDNKLRKKVLEENEKVLFIFYENDKKWCSLFQGVILDLKLTSEGDVHYLNIYAVTSSYFMDFLPARRIFQDVTMTSHKLLHEIMKEDEVEKEALNTFELKSPNSAPKNKYQLLLSIPDVKIGEIVLQYEETDWKFIKRFVSRFGAMVFADCNDINPKVQIGLSEEEQKFDWDKKSYEICQNMERYHYLKENGLEGITVKSATEYRVNSYDIVPLGKKRKIDGQTMYIGKVERELVKGILYNQYTLYYAEGLKIPKAYNDRLTGVSLNARVLGAKRNKIQVVTEIEGKMPPNPYWFPFSTVAASNDGSGWYCMPGKEEHVRVFFPVKDEKESYAITSLSNQNNSSGQEKDPGMKDISANNKQISFTNDGVVVSSDDGTGLITLLQDGSISVLAAENIEIKAAEEINLYAENDLTVSCEGTINLKSDAGSSISMGNEKIELSGNKIYINLPQ